ncbi:MAG: hypothetical protein IH881_01820 [Myxococcales bacterium]|nr:hypothetical protein [Myxococcales bacterium]
MTSSDDENDRPGGENEELRAEIEGLQAALAVARETVEELRSSGLLARAHGDALRVDLELREDEITALRGDHRAALARVSLVEAELAEAQSTIETTLATLAGRDREMSSRDAHVAIAERGIEDRDQQLAIFCKELDRSNEQLSLLEGEVQTQRAMLESSRQAIVLRDDRIAFLQETLRSLEQIASGAVGAEALPHPQVASIPALQPSMVPAPATAAAPAQTLQADPAAVEVALPDGAPGAAEPVAEEPIAEPAAETPTTTVDAATESAPPAASPEPASATEEEETQLYFKDVPPLIPPMLRYWRDTEIEREHPDEAINSVDTLFYKWIEDCCKARPDDTIQIWSLGGGDTQIEVRVAALLKEKQVGNYMFHILDSQPKKLKKQRTMLVNGLELGEKFDTLDGDLENWPADAACDFVIADGSISSAKDPDALLDRIQASCEAGAIFLMTDRIGTATALPQAALDAIGGIFGALSEKQRKNKLEGAFEEEFVDRRESQDASTTQRIVALLEDRFDFEVKLTAGNLIESLAGPEFGPNFKVKELEHRKIFDQLATLDRELMSSENLEARFLVAVLRKGNVSAPLLLGCSKPD